jgi:hypothetical protein
MITILGLSILNFYRDFRKLRMLRLLPLLVAGQPRNDTSHNHYRHSPGCASLFMQFALVGNGCVWWFMKSL